MADWLVSDSHSRQGPVNLYNRYQKDSLAAETQAEP